MNQTKIVFSIIDPSKSYQFIDNGNPKSGAMKDVYFSPDKTYIVGIYKKHQDNNSIERLKKIVTQYYNSMFNNELSDYYKSLFCWPTDVIQYEGKIGLIAPFYHRNFFFQKGYANNDLIKGNEKQGLWFAQSKFRNKTFPLCLDSSELGDWLSYFQIALNIIRGVKRLHSCGLAHSDLSYKNILIDPLTKTAVIIDIDGLVVPGLFPPDVLGTKGFIAPEVLATKNLNKDDPNRKLPNRYTDLHALAVMIYRYLLYRHPLEGSKVHDLDPEIDDTLSFGENALFIEHPLDHSNKPKIEDLDKRGLPWTDCNSIPYTITGPYLTELFNKSFIEGLKNPQSRPVANDWEQAILKTTDLLQPCANKMCQQKWYVFENTNKPKCPFCGTLHEGTLPILDLYYQFEPGVWKPENHRLMVYNNQYLFPWHVNRNIVRNEQLAAEFKKPVGYFTFYHNKWFLVNQKLESLYDATEKKEIPIGSMIELQPDKKILLSKDDGGRLIFITFANI